MARDHRISIKDVAREADVSVTTVSHALNDKGRLNPDTRKRVRDVAERLGYKPNPAARSHVSGKTGLIAVIPSLPKEPRVSFVERGARRVGFLSVPPMTAFLKDSAETYASWCAEHDQEPLTEVIDLAEL